MKKILKYLLGYESEYTKREMSIFTRVVMFLLIFITILFVVLFVAYMKFDLDSSVIKIFGTQYLGFAKVLITGYSVAWIGQMGKAYLAKYQEEKNKLRTKELDYQYESMDDCNFEEDSEEELEEEG